MVGSYKFPSLCRAKESRRAFSKSQKLLGCRLHGVLTPSADRSKPSAICSGFAAVARYQAVRYETQLEWKRNQVKDSFERIGGMEIEVEAVEPSPRTYGYRSKLTPHYERARSSDKRKVGFLRHGSRKVLIDVRNAQ